MTASLPADKLQALCASLSDFAWRRSAHLQRWHSLIRSLSFACWVICRGQLFLHRFINVIHGIKSPRHHVHISVEVRRDCAMWLKFLHNHNGVCLMRDWQYLSSSQLRLFSDASDWGLAVILGTRWVQGHWPDTWQFLHINIREFCPLYLASLSWGSQVVSHSLTFILDNLVVVVVVNKGSTNTQSCFTFCKPWLFSPCLLIAVSRHDKKGKKRCILLLNYIQFMQQ